MSPRLIAAVVVLSLVAGCSSRLNPFNWFRPSQEIATLDPEGGYATARDLRPLVDQVTALSIERTPGGAIVRATGLPPTQGFYDGELVPVGGGEPVNGVLEYDFRIVPPAQPTRVSTPQSREVIVGLFLTTQDLEGVGTIRVNGARNARTSRR